MLQREDTILEIPMCLSIIYRESVWQKTITSHCKFFCKYLAVSSSQDMKI